MAHITLPSFRTPDILAWQVSFSAEALMIVLRPHPQAKLLGAQTQDTQITVAQGMLQQAIDVEFATLPPYLYSL